jgi:hypothetical protein
MHTQKKWCACEHGYGGSSLTMVKKNQPQMDQDLVDFFEDPGAEQEEWQDAKSMHKGHGRLEVREIWESHPDECLVRDRVGRSGAGLSLTALGEEGDKEREEIVYGVTNLPEAREPPPRACSPSNKPIGALK